MKVFVSNVIDQFSHTTYLLQVVNWYLGEMIAQDMGDSQEELLEKKQIVEKVIDRLAYHDNVLVPIGKTGLQARGEDLEQAQEDPILIVHPNYVEDE